MFVEFLTSARRVKQCSRSQVIGSCRTSRSRKVRLQRSNVLISSATSASEIVTSTIWSMKWCFGMAVKKGILLSYTRSFRGAWGNPGRRVCRSAPSQDAPIRLSVALFFHRNLAGGMRNSLQLYLFGVRSLFLGLRVEPCD